MREIPSLSCALWGDGMCPMCARVPAPVECKDCGRLRHTSSLFTIFSLLLYFGRGFPVGSDDKEAACNAGDLGLMPGLGRSPGGGKGYLLQYSGLENSMAYIVHWITQATRILEWVTFPFSKGSSQPRHQTQVSCNAGGFFTN